MNTRKLHCLAFFACLLAVSCIRVEDFGGEQLVGSWQKTLVEYRLAESESEWNEDGNGCYKDDVEDYDSNGYWRLNGGANQCTLGMGILTGSWAWKEKGKRIIFTYQDYPGEYDRVVEFLQENRLVLSHIAGDVEQVEYRTSYVKIK
jgi:hypothetical protein